MKRLGFMLISIVLSITGCSNPKQLNGKYSSDLDYYEAQFEGKSLFPELMLRLKSTRPKLVIDYPQCTFIGYVVSSESSQITEDPKTNVISRVNKELYLFTKVVGGKEMHTPMYYDHANECIYMGGNKFIK